MTAMPPLAILAGGFATRMRPLTKNLPKVLLEVAGKPFIAYQLNLIRREGITRVVLCVGFKGEMIQDFVGDGTCFGLKVAYSSDYPRLLGTGGALRKALPHLGPEFLVMYGDSWLETDYARIVEAYRRSGKPALMTVFRNDGRWDTSNIWFQNGEIRRYDKRGRLPAMRHIDWGLSVCSADLLTEQPADKPFDLADIYAALSRRGQLAGFEAHTRFYEIGSLRGLRETDALLRSKARH